MTVNRYRYLWSTPQGNSQGWRCIEAADDKLAESEARTHHATSDHIEGSEVVLVERL